MYERILQQCAGGGGALKIRRRYRRRSYVFQPLSAAVMFDDPRPFHKLIGAQQKVDPENGQLEDKGGKKAERYGIDPHIDHIADQTETAVSAGAEHTRDQRRIDGGAHDVVGVDQKHIFQVAHSGFGKFRKMQHKRSCGQYQNAACAGGTKAEYGTEISDHDH